MADGKVAFELVSPEQLLLSESVDMVVVPGSEGDFGVLVRHAPHDLRHSSRRHRGA